MKHSKSNLGQNKEDFGVYVHIPYCLQRCTYCDFATYVYTEILPPEKYVEIVKSEIRSRRAMWNQTTLKTIYFGGGTPSLISSQLIVDIINELKTHFILAPDVEITIEINPATVDEKKLNHYLENGVNRFSVGAQTFSDQHLKNVHREHNSKQTLETLMLLQNYKLNYSFDLLFALPHQTLNELSYDLDVALELGMKHISPYCLTVPEGHPLSKNRPLEHDQIEMFQMIHERLSQKKFIRYEISNYAISGFESQHNLLYWTDQPYWGIGLSAHSYSKNSTWGTRFWNPSNIKIYEKSQFSLEINPELSENLEQHQALTDFCHTSLRLTRGLVRQELVHKFDENIAALVAKIADQLVLKNVLLVTSMGWQLSPTGLLISNQVFESFTFLKEDLVQ